MRSFKYLGHVLCNDPSKSSAFLVHQISSAYAKWNEMKSVFLDKIFRSLCSQSFVIFRTGLATGCRKNAEIRIGLVRRFKAFSKRWFL